MNVISSPNFLSRIRASNRKRWLVVAVYAAAMAWVESAVVFYIRTMIDRIEPYQTEPLPLIGNLGPVELVREAATMIMLLTVGMLAGRTWRSRFGFAAIAFGVWDICYYAFLKVMCGWPHSLWDWDILFLLPLPWWGPVLAPMLIAGLMIVWGTLAGEAEADRLAAAGQARRRRSRFGPASRKAWLLNAVGVALALYVFMADCLHVADRGVDVIRNVLPTWFNWPLFSLALVLMASPIVGMLRGRGCGPLNFRRWLAHFEREREEGSEPEWEMPLIIIPEGMPWLVRSLERFARFQSGLAWLIGRAGERLRETQPMSGRLAELWLAENQHHSRLLTCALERFGGRRLATIPLAGLWREGARPLSGRSELQIILAGQLASAAYYRVLERRCRVPALETMCARIGQDLRAHLEFERDLLAAQGSQVDSVIWPGTVRALGCAAAALLWTMQRGDLSQLNVSTAEFFHALRAELNGFVHVTDRPSESNLPETEGVAAIRV